MMFLVTLIAMSSGYALLRKNLNVAGQSMWAYHAPRGNAQPTKELDNDGPDAVELHPHPIWITSHDRQVTWGNKAFKSSETDFVATCKHWLTIGQTDGRIQTHSGAGQVCWYDITTQQQDHETPWFTSPVDGEIRAEAARREFMQTMSKTFAHLSTGLAIFDRKRALIHFNPALLDITGLDFETLSLKPDLASFLDKLRGTGFLPKPKNYHDWRDQLAKLESAAEQGSYRVSGKPLPDGAIAFLLEDAHARETRAELCLLENALNAVTTPHVIFDGLGAYVRSNPAFQSIWPEIAREKLWKNPFRAAFHFGKNGCCQMTLGKKCAQPSWVAAIEPIGMLFYLQKRVDASSFNARRWPMATR